MFYGLFCIYTDRCPFFLSLDRSCASVLVSSSTCWAQIMCSGEAGVQQGFMARKVASGQVTYQIFFLDSCRSMGSIDQVDLGSRVSCRSAI